MVANHEFRIRRLSDSHTQLSTIARFFGLLKRERVNRRQYRTRSEARADIFDYIERFYNPRKRRQLEMRKQKDLLLTQPSAISG